MVHVKLSLLILFLVPVVAVELGLHGVKVPGTEITMTNKSTSVPTTTPVETTAKTTFKATAKVTANATVNANVNTTSQFSRSTKFGAVVKRLTIVGAILTAIVAVYFIVRFSRSGRRKARKYGVVKTPGDVEMHPLESDYDDDDEDVTMFNRKN